MVWVGPNKIIKNYMYVRYMHEVLFSTFYDKTADDEKMVAE